MTRWKAHVEFLLSVIELIFLSLAVEALQGKMFVSDIAIFVLKRDVKLQLTNKAKCVKTRCLQERDGVGHLEPRFQGEEVVPLPIY